MAEEKLLRLIEAHVCELASEKSFERSQACMYEPLNQIPSICLGTKSPATLICINRVERDLA
jgi:hypothetical protein